MTADTRTHGFAVSAIGCGGLGACWVRSVGRPAFPDRARGHANEPYNSQHTKEVRS